MVVINSRFTFYVIWTVSDRKGVATVADASLKGEGRLLVRVGREGGERAGGVGERERESREGRKRKSWYRM